jgi:Ca-activated chloride channel family protein
LRIPFFAALEAVADWQPRRGPWWRLALAALAWILLIGAASRPQLVGDPVQLPVTGRDLLLAVDISGSMQADDMVLGGQPVTRLQVVKSVGGEFISRREGDRLGLILFGEQAYLQTPLTFDRATVRTLLLEAEIGLAGKKTAIGDAIGLAVKRLRDKPQENRVLILLTDGANTAGEIEPLRAADIAAEEGLRIYTIGIGADELVVQDLFGARRINPSADLDEDTLGAIAEKTGGRYFRARDTTDLMKIYTLLDALEPVSMEQETYRPIRELYPWPLAAALLISVVLALPLAHVWRRRGLDHAR